MGQKRASSHEKTHLNSLPHDQLTCSAALDQGGGWTVRHSSSMIGTQICKHRKYVGSTEEVPGPMSSSGQGQTFIWSSPGLKATSALNSTDGFGPHLPGGQTANHGIKWLWFACRESACSSVLGREYPFILGREKTSPWWWRSGCKAFPLNAFPYSKRELAASQLFPLICPVLCVFYSLLSSLALRLWRSTEVWSKAGGVRLSPSTWTAACGHSPVRRSWARMKCTTAPSARLTAWQPRSWTSGGFPLSWYRLPALPEAQLKAHLLSQGSRLYETESLFWVRLLGCPAQNFQGDRQGSSSSLLSRILYRRCLYETRLLSQNSARALSVQAKRPTIIKYINSDKLTGITIYSYQL